MNPWVNSLKTAVKAADFVEYVSSRFAQKRNFFGGPIFSLQTKWGWVGANARRWLNVQGPGRWTSVLLLQPLNLKHHVAIIMFPWVDYGLDLVIHL